MNDIPWLSIGLLIFCWIVLAGCTSQPLLPIPQTEPISLSGTVPMDVAFHLVSYRVGQEDQVVPIGYAPITVTFGGDGRLAGSSGCNIYSADYRVNGPALTIGTPEQDTRVLCEPLVMIQEQRYLSLLPQAVSYGMIGPDTLVVYDHTGDVIMMFERIGS
jgi:heat shock protein HslJ